MSEGNYENGESAKRSVGVDHNMRKGWFGRVRDRNHLNYTEQKAAQRSFQTGSRINHNGNTTSRPENQTVYQGNSTPLTSTPLPFAQAFIDNQVRQGYSPDVIQTAFEQGGIEQVFELTEKTVPEEVQAIQFEFPQYAHEILLGKPVIYGEKVDGIPLLFLQDAFKENAFEGLQAYFSFSPKELKAVYRAFPKRAPEMIQTAYKLGFKPSQIATAHKLLPEQADELVEAAHELGVTPDVLAIAFKEGKPFYVDETLDNKMIPVGTIMDGSLENHPDLQDPDNFHFADLFEGMHENGLFGLDYGREEDQLRKEDAA